MQRKQKQPKKKQNAKKVVPNTHPTEGKISPKVGYRKTSYAEAKKYAAGKKFENPYIKLSEKKTAAEMSFGANDSRLTKVGTNVMNIQGELQMSTLQIGLATYLSSLYFYNAPGSYTDSTGQTGTQAWLDAAQGTAYLGAAIQQISQGATQSMVKCPRIFDILTQMLTEKSVRLGSGIVKYSPTWSAPFEMPGYITTPTGAIWTAAPPDNGNLVQFTSNPYAPSEDSYSTLLKMAEYNKMFGSGVVDVGKNTGLFSIDPSCYARIYPYFGSGGSPQIACYNEVELEAPFAYPQLARFALYDQSDKVISRIFHPSAGGIGTAIGQTLTQNSNYSLLRNPIPAVYKFCDLYQVYSVLAAYAVSLLEQNLTVNSAPVYTPRTFSFTASEFCLLLRQAILTQNPSQIHAQWVAPQAATPNNNVSVFEPFIVDAVTTPNSSFTQFLLPLFLQENLNMLKPATVKINSTPGSKKNGTVPKKLENNFYPVWGVYSGDTPPIFQFDINGVASPLFNQGVPEIDARLWDGVSNTNPSVKYNLNGSRLQEIMTEWNSFMAAFQNHSSTIVQISGDQGPGVSLLMYTRVLENISPTLRAQKGWRGASYDAPLYNNIINKPRGVEHTSADKKKTPVKAVPPASYFDLYPQTLLAHKQMAMDYIGALRYFIIPTIRLDAGGVDPITQAAYSVYTGEVCSTSYTSGTVVADNEVARLFVIGQLMTSGMFAASANNNILTQSVDELAKGAQGNDLIKSILGGMASLIPGVGGVISNVIQGL